MLTGDNQICLSTCLLLKCCAMAVMLEPEVVQLYWGYWLKATHRSTPSLQAMKEGRVSERDKGELTKQSRGTPRMAPHLTRGLFHVALGEERTRWEDLPKIVCR